MHFTSGARRSLRMPLAAAFAAFIGLVPAVFVATPAYAAGEVDFTSDQESVENDAFVFELVRQGGSASKLDLTYTTENGTAVAGEDYTAISGTTSFPANSVRATTKKFTVQGLSDALDEDDETFSLKFTHMLNGQPVIVNGEPLTVTAQGILDDDDLTPTYSLSVPDPVAENAAVARITATLSPVSGRAVTIPITTSNGTAVQPGDYTTTNDTISIPVGQTTGYRDVPVIDDLFDEENIETFSVTGAAGSNGEARTGPVLQARIEDNDAMPTVDVSSQGAVFEGTQIDFTVELSAASNRVVTVVANTEAGTASAADFTAITDELVVFQPGETSETVTVQTATDLRDELNPEDLKLELSAPALPTQGYFTPGTMEATGHISDDDALPVVSMIPPSVTEGNAGSRTDTFTVTLDAASGREVRVGYAVESDTATEGEDFEAVTSGELVFAPGSTSETFTVNIKGDVKDEPDEDFKVTLSNAAGTASLMPSAVHAVTIEDNDATPALATFPDLSTAEGDAEATKSIQVALTNPSSSQITLAVTPTPDSAVIAAGGPGANDFDAPSETVIIPAGQTTANVTFQVNGDEVYEGAETATIKVATTPNDPAIVAGDLTSTLTLTNDDDAPVVELHAQTGRVEGQTATITATVTGVSQDPIAITPAAAADAPPNGDPAEPGEFDAANLLAAASLPGGTINNPWTVGTVALSDDTADENAETVKVSMTGLPDIAPVWLTINDDPDDMAPTVVAAGVQKNEADGTVQVPVTLDFGQNGNQADSTQRRITAVYTTEDGTAKQPGDYDAATGTVEFEPGGDTSTSIPVTINEDTTFERSELFKVKLAEPSPSDVPVAPASVNVGIADNDSGQEPVLDGLVAPVVAFREGTEGTADFTVELDRAAAEDVDVKVTVTDVTATHGVVGVGKDDFEVPDSPVTVPAGVTSVVVPITINSDEVYELTETATVSIELAPGEADAVNAAQPVSATLTIVDDDAQPTVVLNTADGGAEGSTVPVTATMTGVSQDPIEVTLAAVGDTHDGSHQAQPQDFTATFIVTELPAGVVGGPVALGSIALANDTVDEYDQTVKVSLTGLTSTTAPSWVTIADAVGDKAPTVVAAGVQKSESDGTVQVPVTLVFGQNGNQASSTERKVTAGYATADGTAKQPVDYAAATGTVEFEPGDTSKSIPVTIKTDGVYERGEAFAVNLSTPSPSDVPIAPASVTVQVSDVDSASKPVVDGLVAPLVAFREGTAGTADFTVELDRPASEDVDVAVTITPGTATTQSNLPGKNDFDAPAGPVTVPAGDTSVVVPITINNDAVYEHTEAATVTVTVASDETDAVNAQSPVTATLTIVDDDTQPTVVLNTVDGAEGDTVAVTATMSGVSQDPIAITPAAAGDTHDGSHQAQSEDFTATFTATQLPAGVVNGPVALGSILLKDDLFDEYDQTVKVSLTGLTSTTAPVWVTIADAVGDKAPTVVAAGVQKNESDGTVQVPVTLDFGQNGNQAGSTERKITAGYTTEDGTAKQPGDYASATGTVEFEPGDTSKSIPVTIGEDTTFERSELFKVKLSNPSPSDVPVAPASVNVGIADNDSGQEPVLDGLVAPVVAFREGTEGTADFTVELDRIAAEDVDVKVTVTDVTATHGVVGVGKDDFEVPASPVTVPAGVTSVVVPITVKNDGVFELTETATVSIELAPGETDAVNAAQPVSATFTIVDDDAQPTVVLNTVDGVEGGTVAVTATMTGVSQDPIAITPAAAGDTHDGSHPAQSEDFTATFTATQLPAGVVNGPVALGSILLKDDLFDEYDQTVKVSLTGLTSTTAPVWVTIADAVGDKAPTVAAAGVQVAENAGAAQVPVTLDFGQNGNQASSTERKITAGYATADGTAKTPGDYLAATGTIEFEPGDFSESIPVTIKTDGVYERSEAFAVNLSTPSPSDVPIAPASVTVQINDADSASKPVVDDLVAPVVAFREGTEGTADFTVKLDRAASEDVDVTVTVTDVTATHGVVGVGKDDFEAPASPVTVPAGDTLVVVPITVKNDGVFELTETATVSIELAPGETDAVNAAQPISATFTIVDDDTQPTAVLNTADGAEGDTVAVTATMTGVSQDPIAVTLAAAGEVHDGSQRAEPEDFTATFTATALPAGVVGGPVALGSILLKNDTFDEYDQTVKVSLTGLTSTTVPAWVTIADAAGDKAPTVVAAGVQKSESDGTVQVPVTLDFTQNGNQASSTERKVTAAYTTADGTAKKPGDYTAASGSVEFEPGDTSESIPVTIKTDGVYERSEAFAVNLSTPSPSEAPIAPASVTVQINDADSASRPVLHQLATSATQVKEGVTATVDFTVQLDRPASEDVAVAVTVTPGTATTQSNLPGKNDFDAPAGPVTVPAGDTSVVVPITINNDEVYEHTEAATVTVAVASDETDAVDAQSPVTATLTIEDNDAAPTVTALSGVGSAAEGSSPITVQAAMTGVAQDAYPITLTVAGTANLAGSDPAEPGDFDRTALVTSLPAGLHAATVSLGTITVLDDNADEWDETIRVTLTGAGTPDPSWLTITDDPDDLPPAVVIADPAQPVGESAGAALVPVTLDFDDSEDADSTQKTVTVKYATANATARAPGDYTAAETGASVSFTPGVTDTNISVAIASDQVFERTEDFTVTITEPAPTGVQLGDDVATVTIADDDSVRKPTFSVSDASFTEGAIGNATFTVTLSAATTQPVDFDVAVDDDTATHGSNLTGPGQNDYTEPAATVTVPTGASTVTIPVPVLNDTAYEGEEAATLTVSLASEEDDATGTSDSGDLIITDNDNRPSIELTPSSGTEGTDLQIKAVVTGVAQRDLPFDLAFAGDSPSGANPAEAEDYTDNDISGVVPGGYNPVRSLTLGTVTLNQDEVDEPAEYFRITATDTADSDRVVSAAYRINDDPNDLPPSIAIDAVTTVGEDVGSAEVTVGLTFDSDATSTESDLSVGWQTSDGSAKAVYDYTATTGTLDFPAGTTEATLTVPIRDDVVDEPAQDFSVTLDDALPKGIVIAEDTGEVQIDDDDATADPTLTAPANRTGAGPVSVTGVAGEGAQVRIYAAAASAPTTWSLATTVTANLNGAYTASVSVDMGSYLQARVGNAASEAKLVRVTQVPVLTATSTTAGVVNLTVAGNPRLGGLAVTIQRLNANGSWSTVITGTTASTTKTYAYALRGQKSGTTITFRATIAVNATSGTLAGTSVSRAVKVR